jgi:hypothetical protein
MWTKRYSREKQTTLTNMNTIQRKFDFAVIAPHCCGRTFLAESLLVHCGANILYLRRTDDGTFNFVEPYFTARNKPCQRSGLVIDFPNGSAPEEVIEMLVPDHPLVILSRDPVDRLKSYANNRVYVAAGLIAGCVGDPKSYPGSYRRYDADAIEKKILSYSLRADVTQWQKTLALLLFKAGPRIFVDFEDLRSEKLSSIMRAIGTEVFGDSHAWSGMAVNTPAGGSLWEFFTLLRKKLELTDSAGRLFCQLLPVPRGFLEAAAADPSLILSCPRDSIGFQCKDFDGDLAWFIVT